MTIIVGIVCADGIVIAADSQETIPEAAMKRLGVAKIYDNRAFELPGVELLVAGAGGRAYMSGAYGIVEQIREMGRGKQVREPRELAGWAESALGEMGKRYTYLDLQLLLAVRCDSRTKKGGRLARMGLYRVLSPIRAHSPEDSESVGVAETVEGCVAIGSGDIVGNYILQRIQRQSSTLPTMERAIREAVYTIEEAKKLDPYIGGRPRVACLLHAGSVEWKSPREVASIVEEIKNVDGGIRKQQVTMLDQKSKPHQKTVLRKL